MNFTLEDMQRAIAALEAAHVPPATCSCGTKVYVWLRGEVLPLVTITCANHAPKEEDDG